jgi:hypothetical protein
MSKIWRIKKKKSSQIYSRKTKNCKIFPISLSKNNEISPGKKHTGWGEGEGEFGWSSWTVKRQKR